MKKSILITGIAGLIGSRFADWILESKSEYDVIGIDDLSGGYIENVPKDTRFYNLNLINDDFEFLFKDFEIKYIFHFAAYAAEGLSPFIRKFNYDNNLKATAGLINCAIKYDIEKFIFTSSLAVYGHGEGGVFDEEMIPKPIDPYGIAKYACEMDLQVAGEQHGLEWVIIRPHNVYGVKQNIWDKYRNVLGIWMFQTLNDQPLTIFGDGEQKRAFSYIDDILTPLWIAAENKEANKQIINLGGIREYSINNACDIFKSISNYNNVKYLEQRHEVKISVPTYKKSEDLLGFKHKIELKDGLESMWAWAKSQQMRDQFVWDKYELEKGIYSFWKR